MNIVKRIILLIIILLSPIIVNAQSKYEISELELDKINELVTLLKSKGLTNKDIVEVISKTLNINKNKISKLLY